MNFVADTHTHTLASAHAYSTITENVAAAAAVGLKCIAMTDHFGVMPDAPHVWHFHNLVALPRTLHGVHILRGAEVNILDCEGNIDLTDPALLSSLEWIVASIHAPVFQPRNKQDCTGAYAGAAVNPAVDCIGHSESENYDFETVFRLLRDHGKLLELNNSRLLKNPRAPERAIKMLKLARKLDVRVIVNSDAHFHDAVGRLDASSEILREADFPAELVVNADWARFHAYVDERHPDALPE